MRQLSTVRRETSHPSPELASPVQSKAPTCVSSLVSQWPRETGSVRLPGEEQSSERRATCRCGGGPAWGGALAHGPGCLSTPRVSATGPVPGPCPRARPKGCLPDCSLGATEMTSRTTDREQVTSEGDHDAGDELQEGDSSDQRPGTLLLGRRSLRCALSHDRDLSESAPGRGTAWDGWQEARGCREA